jgi:sugar phosphate isomerase/epimerase
MWPGVGAVDGQGLIRPGLCSVTLRSSTVEQVVTVAAGSGLAAIEWGGDVHVPAGDQANAQWVRELTTGSGMTVASYGSYFRIGSGEDFRPVLDSAVALGAPRIRVWAGKLASAEAELGAVERIVRDARAVAAMAADVGVSIAFEYHAGTLTDSTSSTLRLLGEVDRPNVSTYWQPRVGEDDAAALDGLGPLLPYLTAVHVFSWWPDHRRLPLVSRSALWTGVFELLSSVRRPFDSLLEFVPDDRASSVPTEAATLRRMLGIADRPDDITDGKADS